MLLASTLAAGCMGLSWAGKYNRYQQWPVATARYEGMSVQTTGSGRGRSKACTRSYSFVHQGRKVHASTPLSKCRVVFGPDPDVGDAVTVAHHPTVPTRIVSEVDVYTVGAWELVAIVMWMIGAIMTPAGLVIGIVLRLRAGRRTP